jgi:Endosomal/lysosomal potassium channel TMEM175
VSESHNHTMRLSETARVEAFSDGVFAIIITLLVLDVRTPKVEPGHLLYGLLQQWPTYFAFVTSFLQRRDSPTSRGSGSTYPLGREGLAIDRRLQRHGRCVAQGCQGEAGRFGHLDQLSHTLGRLVTVERQLRLDRVTPRVCVAGDDRAFTGVPRGDSDAAVFRLDVERSCHLHELRGESESHRDGEVAQGRGRAVRPPDAR